MHIGSPSTVFEPRRGVQSFRSAARSARDSRPTTVGRRRRSPSTPAPRTPRSTATTSVATRYGALVSSRYTSLSIAQTLSAVLNEGMSPEDADAQMQANAVEQLEEVGGG